MRPTPPTAGTIYSSDADPTLKLVIDDVSEPEADGFFLVSLGDADDQTAPGMELDGWEWEAMANKYRLKPISSAGS